VAALEPEDLAYLAPHLMMIGVHRGQVLCEPGETVKYTYFPQDAMVSLVTVMRDGKSAEMAVFGREGLFGLVSAFVSSHAFGRYIA
jgi:CRP-like cAMP-binding protein